MDLISVIIPVYKTEAYLNKCIESIVNQTYVNLEIILVDDGSPDNCPYICDEWSVKDSRIKVLHIKNGGAGNARNIGMMEANGEWLSFIDSDDYVSNKFFEYLMNHVNEETDIAECDYVITHDDDAPFQIEGRKNNKYVGAQDAIRANIMDVFFKQVIWNKIYRKSVAKEYLFPVGKVIDDEYWTYKVLAKARKLVSLSSKLYAYRQQEQSVMHAPFSLNRLQAIEAKCQRLQFIETRFPNLVPLAKKDLWLTCMYMGQMLLLKSNGEEIQRGFEIINKTIHDYPLTKDEMALMKLDYKLWAMLSKISMYRVCKLRNILKIGI